MPKYHLRANIYKRPSNPIYESSLSLRFPVSFGQSIFKFWFSNESLLSSTNQVAEDTFYLFWRLSFINEKQVLMKAFFL
jgi:hypothetical protein